MGTIPGAQPAVRVHVIHPALTALETAAELLEAPFRILLAHRSLQTPNKEPAWEIMQ